MNRGWKYAHTRHILTYALDGKAKVPAFDRPTFKVAPLDNPGEALDPKVVALGKAVSLACAACHGRNLVSAGGPAPDLRESAIPLDPAAFRSVVHDGALMERGMPRFDTFTTKQIEGLRQYIRSRARATLASKR
jgi:quinohemoprotein ethanol dehydrogenase